ncbi:hypothetical protein GTP58_03365 [Duganella sp. CY15W]|uniref:hypothetical protein n=1 Tax=Duganella sp. CY15W TaxID=2692172 RepID=UPI001368924F|nr:hypothetical protein [Duganella sp. CY15W]MYM27359.1 hypothetical protein [Duganella sp. CY15W]
MRMRVWTLMALALLPAVASAAAGAKAGAPLRADHPVVGTWRITLPDGSCTETYRIRADGTTLVFSNEEVAESTFTISDQPDKEGFYKETDTIFKDNGKRDCSGEVTKPGKAVTSYLQFHPNGNLFVMCVERDLERCIGPFIRVRGDTI